MVQLRVVVAVVDAEHDRDVRVGRRGRDDDLLRARVEVLLRTFAVREEAGRLEHHVHAEVAPGEIGRIAFGEELELLAGSVDDAVGEHDVTRPVSYTHLRAERVLCAEEVAADPAEAVDADPGCHASLASVVREWIRDRV